MRALRDAVASSGARVSEISIVEDIEASRRLARATLSDEADRREANALAAAMAPLFDGIAVASSRGIVLARSGERRLWISVEGREFPLTPATFFQANRYLVGPLFSEVRRLAAAVEPGRALDLFGGVGLFAGALLDSGHQVVTAEAHHAAVEQALAAVTRWKADAWKIVHAGAQDFLDKPRELFDVIVADPPRAGLGLPLRGRARPPAAETPGLRLLRPGDPGARSRGADRLGAFHRLRQAVRSLSAHSSGRSGHRALRLRRGLSQTTPGFGAAPAAAAAAFFTGGILLGARAVSGGTASAALAGCCLLLAGDPLRGGEAAGSSRPRRSG